MSDVPELKTRKPTGKPPWPIVLLAGGEKTGKSWAAAAFSASDLIGRTFFVEIGESYADEYGAIPGARYEICEHDGSYRGIRGQIYAATQAPRVDGKPNCIIVDSMTLLWDLLSDQAQRTAYARWRKKNPNKPEPDGEVQITMDLWNIAKKRWNDILDLLRRHDGPVLLTARLEQVAVMAPNGQPTTDKTLKVKAEKNLPYEVDVIVQMPSPRKYQITGLRSVKFQIEPDGAWPFPDFTVDALLRRLGLDAAGATAPRVVTSSRPAAEPSQPAEAAERGFDRSRPTGPAEDEFAIPPDAARPQPTEVRQAGASTSVQNKLIGLIEGKLDITDRDDQMRWISGQLRRHVATPDQLGVSDAMGLIRRLEDTLDREQPWDNQPQVPPAAESKSAAAAAAESWSHRMLADRGAGLPAAPTQPPKWTENDREQLLADTYADMAAALNPEELGTIAARVVEAYNAGKIRLKDKNDLEKDYARLMRVLRGSAVNA